MAQSYQRNAARTDAVGELARGRKPMSGGPGVTLWRYRSPIKQRRRNPNNSSCWQRQRIWSGEMTTICGHLNVPMKAYLDSDELRLGHWSRWSGRACGFSSVANNGLRNWMSRGRVTLARKTEDRESAKRGYLYAPGSGSVPYGR